MLYFDPGGPVTNSANQSSLYNPLLERRSVALLMLLLLLSHAQGTPAELCVYWRLLVENGIPKIAKLRH